MPSHTRIVVRLPDHLVAFVDEQVRAGEESRAAVLTRAVISLQHQQSIEHGAEILRTGGDAEEWEDIPYS